MENIQADLLKLLLGFDSFCKKHSLKYELAWGTLIGAVRHKGFIPWDDDVDVVMPLGDYRMLQSVFEKEGDPRFELLSYKGTKGYYLPFFRFVYKRKETHNKKGDHRRFDSSWLDVFPLLPIPSTNSLGFRSWKRMRHRICRILALKSTPIHLCTGTKKVVRLFSFCFPEKLLRSRLWASDSRFEKAGCELVYLQDLWESNDSSIAMPAYWFDETSDFIFEGYRFSGPKMFDAVLSHYYGDYMIPPPIEEQKSRHGRDA